jgi:acetyl esterase/lipase
MNWWNCRQITRSLPFRALSFARDFRVGFAQRMSGSHAALPIVGWPVADLVHTAARRMRLPQTAELEPQERAKLHNAATESLSSVVPAERLSEAWPAPGRIAPVLSAVAHRWRYLYRSAVPYGDAPEQVLDIWRGKDLPAEPAPVLIFVPAGAWLTGKHTLQGCALMSHLAQQGWLCLAIEHRAGRAHPWPRHVQDVNAAIAWARANVHQFGGDPGFVAIAGASSGAHLAALSALTHDDPDYRSESTPDANTSVDAVIALYGRYDWQDRSTRESKGFVQFLERLVVGKRIKHHPDVFRNASPIARVRPDAPPFFVVHGTADRFVPVSHARAFVEKLRSTSRSRVGYLEIPDARHCFDLTDGLRAGTAVTAIGLFLDEIHRTTAPRTPAKRRKSG